MLDRRQQLRGRGVERVLPLLAILAMVLGGTLAGAQAPPDLGTLTMDPAPSPAASATSPELQAAAAGSCPGQAPPAGPCSTVSCVGGEWVEFFKAVGTACNDSNACTYSDKCVDGIGTCRGTAIACVARGPCETSTCNGTEACSVALRPAGTACPYSNTGNPADPPNPCENACDGAGYRCQP